MGNGKLPDDVKLIELLEENHLPPREVARRFGVTVQAVYYRTKKIRENVKRDPSVYPFDVLRKHGGGPFDRGARAHFKWGGGGKLTPREKADATRLRETCERLNAVMSYDQKAGYWFRDRRKSDGVDILVVE